LGCPIGSLSSRLSRGRTMLGKRLARHGPAVSAPTLAAVLTQSAAANVPAASAAATIRAATLLAAGRPGALSSTVPGLMNGALRAMMRVKLRLSALWLMMSLVALGGGLWIYQSALGQADGRAALGPAPAPGQDPKPKQARADQIIAKDAGELVGEWA